jgi:hypothetical protein
MSEEVGHTKVTNLTEHEDGGDDSELLMTKAKSEPEEPMSNPGDKDYEV